MHTIAVISQKGGTGKTTMTVSLAAVAARELVTLILDTDPQGDRQQLERLAGRPRPRGHRLRAPSLLAGKLKRSAELGAELALIDTPPHADAMARQAAILADLILIPCRPRAFDLAALEATGELVRSIRIPAFVVFNAGPPRAPRVYEEAAEIISGFGLQMAPVTLAERAAFHHATAAGVSAPEFAADSRASAELTALWRWTRTPLNTSTPRQETLAGSRRVSQFGAIRTRQGFGIPAAGIRSFRTRGQWEWQDRCARRQEGRQRPLQRRDEPGTSSAGRGTRRQPPVPHGRVVRRSVPQIRQASIRRALSAYSAAASSALAPSNPARCTAR